MYINPQDLEFKNKDTFTLFYLHLPEKDEHIYIYVNERTIYPYLSDQFHDLFMLINDGIKYDDKWQFINGRYNNDNTSEYTTVFSTLYSLINYYDWLLVEDFKRIDQLGFLDKYLNGSGKDIARYILRIEDNSDSD